MPMHRLVRILLLSTSTVCLMWLAGCQAPWVQRHFEDVPSVSARTAPLLTPRSHPIEQLASKKTTVGKPSPLQRVDRVQLTNHEESVVSKDVNVPEPPTTDTETASLDLPDGLTLDLLKSLALQYSPSIHQAQAAAQKAVGFQEQVGLRPNPSFGYNGSQLADKNTDQHTVYVSQDFVTGQKLQRNRNVLCHDVQSLRWDVESERRRVLSDVQRLYYEALGAQEALRWADQFVEIGEEVVSKTNRRKEAGESSLVDALQADMQLGQVMVVQRQTMIRVRAAYQELSSLTGSLDVTQQGVSGRLPEKAERLDFDVELSRLESLSPELASAAERVSRARANIDRQEAQATPNLSVTLSAGHDRGTNHGLINSQVGLPLPIFNYNQGNVSAAMSEYWRAAHEQSRLRTALKTRLAHSVRDYEVAGAAVDLYRTSIVPKSTKALAIAKQTYEGGEIDFLQVLLIRRAYFDAKLAYVAAQTSLAQAQSLIEHLQLAGSQESSHDSSTDDGLRGQALSGQ